MQSLIACAQFAPVAGAPERNVQTMGDLLRLAARRGARIAVFPELCLGGYPSPDQARHQAVRLEGGTEGQTGLIAAEYDDEQVAAFRRRVPLHADLRAEAYRVKEPG